MISTYLLTITWNQDKLQRLNNLSFTLNSSSNFTTCNSPHSIVKRSSINRLRAKLLRTLSSRFLIQAWLCKNKQLSLCKTHCKYIHIIKDHTVIMWTMQTLTNNTYSIKCNNSSCKCRRTSRISRRLSTFLKVKNTISIIIKANQ
jgi:hypothetical protein